MSHFVSVLADGTLSRIRAETPGLRARNHFDNAGSALMATPVINVVKGILDTEAQFGGYVAQAQHADVLENVYHQLARLLGGHQSDYALVGNAVDGWTRAFYSIPFKSGDVIVTAYNEYCANYVAYLHVAKNKGVEIRVARSLPEGGIDINHMETLIDARTRLISISHMPSSSGEIVQAAEVGTLAKKHDILYQLDACQSAGQIPIDVKVLGCDIMTGTSRKFLRGPRGVGFLYVSEKARAELEPVILTNQSAEWVSTDTYHLREDARVFEAWERSVVNQIGFGAAIEYLLEIGVEPATQQIAHNAAYLRSALRERTGIRMVCPSSASSAIITFNVHGYDAADVKHFMEERSIAVQVAQEAHTRLDYEARSINSAVRVSPHYYTSQSDMDALLAALDELCDVRP